MHATAPNVLSGWAGERGDVSLTSSLYSSSPPATSKPSEASRMAQRGQPAGIKKCGPELSLTFPLVHPLGQRRLQAPQEASKHAEMRVKRVNGKN